VQVDKPLAEKLERAGVRVKFQGVTPPRHKEVSGALVEALARCTEREVLRRKYAWGLLLSYVGATGELIHGPHELREVGTQVLGA
jgi:hypothetical protein